MAEIKSKHQYKKEILEQLIDGNHEQANSLYKSAEMEVTEYNELGTKAFVELKRKKEYVAAIKICEEFNMPPSKLLETIVSQFHSYNEARDYDSAMDWGAKYTLPKNDLNAMAVKGFNYYLSSKKIDEALAFKKKYDIPEELIISQARTAYNNAYENKDFITAMHIGCIFNLLRKRTLTSGMRAYKYLIESNELKKFIVYENEYHLMIDNEINNIDQTDPDAFANSLDQKVIATFLEKNDFAKLKKLTDSIKIYENIDNNVLMRVIADSINSNILKNHNNLLKKGATDKAFELVEMFHLLSNKVQPDFRNELIKNVEEKHNELLSSGSLPQAEFLKTNYDLFSKNVLSESTQVLDETTRNFITKAMKDGELGLALRVIKEYELESETVKTTAMKVLSELVKNEEFSKCFEIMSTLKIKVTDPDILGDVSTAFHRVYENDQIELASNISYHFKLNEERAKKAAAKHWKNLIENKKYPEALAIYKSRKFLKKILAKDLQKMYETLLDENDTFGATQLREQYRINISIITLVLEYIKKMFGK